MNRQLRDFLYYASEIEYRNPTGISWTIGNMDLKEGLHNVIVELWTVHPDYGARYASSHDTIQDAVTEWNSKRYCPGAYQWPQLVISACLVLDGHCSIVTATFELA